MIISRSPTCRGLARTAVRTPRRALSRAAGATAKPVPGRDTPRDPGSLGVSSPDLDAGAGLPQPGRRLLRVLPAHVLQNRPGGRIDQVLGLLEAQLGDLPDRLDHVDLAVPGGLEEDRELDLLFLGLLFHRRRGRDRKSTRLNC